MRLKELCNIPANGAPKTEVYYDEDDTYLVHHANNIKVYVIDDTTNIIYCIFSEDLSKPAIAYLCLATIPAIIDGDEYHQVSMTWVDPRERGNSYGLYLRQIVCKILNIKIITDDHASAAGVDNVKKNNSDKIFLE